MRKGILRGYGLGSPTGTPDRTVEPAPRVMVRFTCRRGHEFTVPFAESAELPASWECTQHGLADCPAVDDHTTRPGPDGKPLRTHLVMLMERRTTADLDALVDSALAAVRRQGGAQPGCVCIAGRPYSFAFPTGGA
ncbi:RNA polymerase-binding protein RbpA [Actinokineospora sp. NBRC 105648]|nr:RNA polymerase-binding protein RbpA [Actinokineospora sp. NBRC 105648]